jgi:hypothetical protein
MPLSATLLAFSDVVTLAGVETTGWSATRLTVIANVCVVLAVEPFCG